MSDIIRIGLFLYQKSTKYKYNEESTSWCKDFEK